MAASNPVTLAPAEWEVMKVLWEKGPMAARDVVDALPEERRWAPKTVKTLLSRLVAKGAVDYDQIGNSYLYRAAVPRDAMTKQEVRTVFERVMSNTMSSVLAHFIEEAELTDDDVKLLKQKLSEKSSKRKRAKRGGTESAS